MLVDESGVFLETEPLRHSKKEPVSGVEALQEALAEAN